MAETRKIVTMTSPDHGKYVGEAKGFIRHGQGCVTMADGFKYEGEFVDGRPLGFEELDEMDQDQQAAIN